MSNHLEVAHEDRMISGVEADEGCKQSDVGFGDMRAKQVRLVSRGAEVRFQTVKRGKEGVDVGVIRLLARGEAALVDPMIDGIVNPLVHLINLLTQMLWVKPAAGPIDLLQVLRE